MVPLRSAPNPDITQPQVSAPKASGFLNHLRFVAMHCRAKPRADLFQACALLQVNHNATQQAHAEALMRCLPEALGKPAKLFAPGVNEMTFDETWLVQLGRAAAAKDEASMAFLLRSRVAQPHRRLVGFLVTQVSEYFTIV